MNKIEAMSSPRTSSSRRFETAPKAFLRERTNRRVASVALSEEEAYLAMRYEAAYDRLACQLANIDSLLARYATMGEAEQAERTPCYTELVNARAFTLTAIDQAIFLVNRVYTHLNGTFDSEHLDEDSGLQEPMSVAMIDCYQNIPDYALECALERHEARRIVFIDRDEENWAVLPEFASDYTNEDYRRLQQEDELYESAE